MQVVAPAEEYMPAEQLLQLEDALVLLNLPAGHWVQFIDPFKENIPVWHE
jgi:hypothetical protein